MIEIYIIDDHQNDQLGAGALYAEGVSEVTWNYGSPDAGAIKNYFVGRKFRVESADVHRITGTNKYTIGVRFIGSKMTNENLRTFRNAFLEYVAANGYPHYADVHYIGANGQPIYDVTETKTGTPTGSSTPPANTPPPGTPKPKGDSLGAQLDDLVKKYGSYLPWVVAGAVVLAFKD